MRRTWLLHLLVSLWFHHRMSQRAKKIILKRPWDFPDYDHLVDALVVNFVFFLMPDEIR